MPDFFTVSRRKAAILIAGTLAAYARPAVAGAAVHSGTRLSARSGSDLAARSASHLMGDDVHHQIGLLLRNVRSASGTARRAEAFERCKAALRAHELAEATLSASGRAGSSALYRYADPSAVLAAVIVRELDAMPVTDPGWLKRFADLESAFEAHVDEHGSAAA